MEFLTFFLAMLGYAGLAIVVVAASSDLYLTRLWRGTAVTIALHVACVWLFRYEGQLSQATRNGWIGFVLFHFALLLIVLSLILAPRGALLLIRSAYVITSAGALGAVFRYDVVAVYRVPVILAALTGNVLLARTLWVWATQANANRSSVRGA